MAELTSQCHVRELLEHQVQGSTQQNVTLQLTAGQKDAGASDRATPLNWYHTSALAPTLSLGSAPVVSLHKDSRLVRLELFPFIAQ